MPKHEQHAPRLGLRRQRAAISCDVSVNYFDTLVREGKLPPARILGAVRIWVVAELETALLSLPTDQHGGLEGFSHPDRTEDIKNWDERLKDE